MFLVSLHILHDLPSNCTRTDNTCLCLLCTGTVSELFGRNKATNIHRKNGRMFRSSQSVSVSSSQCTEIHICPKELLFSSWILNSVYCWVNSSYNIYNNKKINYAILSNWSITREKAGCKHIVTSSAWGQLCISPGIDRSQ